jgi:hypothetical protein
VLSDRLSLAEQEAFEPLRLDPEFYGILRPRQERLTAKSVSRDTALLLLSLDKVSPLPKYAVDELGDCCDSVVSQMVLDEVLEIEVEGELLSGPQALPALGSGPAARGTDGSLAALSRRALEYGQSLEITDAPELSRRLYAYNRVPASSRWLRLLPNESAAQQHLGLDEESLARMLSGAWIEVPLDSSWPWMAWQSRRSARHDPAARIYKLYVSPACTDLPLAFVHAVAGLSRSKAFQWKVGRNVYGLLRPDKIVAYFHDFTDLQETAAYLAERFDGCAPHGVPFTAELGGGGLLSWGVDPPRERGAVSWLMRESWRARICNRLALALLAAKASVDADVSPSEFALARLQLDGIDTQTWAPQR